LLTLAWYLNHSDRPNVAADKNYNFYSIRRIKKGEELTADYDTYSYIKKVR
jgi:SET domain-containing protein